LRANIFNLLKVVVAKRRESFRWADLVSGNLKEEKDASLDSTGAFEWPSPSRRTTYCIDRPESRSGNAESGVHRVLLAEASTNGTL
jgi:hypothetical protein